MNAAGWSSGVPGVRQCNRSCREIVFRLEGLARQFRHDFKKVVEPSYNAGHAIDIVSWTMHAINFNSDCCRRRERGVSHMPSVGFSHSTWISGMSIPVARPKVDLGYAIHVFSVIHRHGQTWTKGMPSDAPPPKVDLGYAIHAFQPFHRQNWI